MNVRYVTIGEVAFGKPGTELRTVLGSCVAITLWNPAHRVGCLSHIQLPDRLQGAREGTLDGRYAEEAWALMCDALSTAGLSPRECECKLFGGARVTRLNSLIGERNLDRVRGLLTHHAITVANTHVAGTGYRELRFRVATGETLVRHHVAAFPGTGEAP